MSKTIRPDDLAVLRYLDEQSDELRRQLGLHQRGEIVTWYERPGSSLEYIAVADGFGKFDLLEYEGRNPNDRVVHHQTTYDNEEAAWLAAMRLGELGVAWEDRDKPIPNEEESEGT
jgi:hypothetical protein